MLKADNGSSFHVENKLQKAQEEHQGDQSGVDQAKRDGALN